MELEWTRPQDAGLDPARLGRLAGALQREIDRRRLPGAVAMIGRRGRVAWTHCAGGLDPRHPVPMRPDALFRIYSMTKPIVSLAVMMLVEENRLALTDPLERFVPEFGSVKVSVQDGDRHRLEAPHRSITVQDLLRHTSGLTYDFVGNLEVHRRYAAANLADRTVDNATQMRRLAALPLAHQPGTQWEYSRATDVLGHLVELASGQTLGGFLAQRIFAPLGMTDTAFHVAPEHHHRIAEPFGQDPDTGAPVRVIEPRDKPAFESGGGGLISSLADYTRLLKLLAGGGRLGNERLVSRDTLAFMTADHLGAIPNASPLLAPGHGFGLGFAVRTHAGLAPLPGSVGSYFWGGIAGTTFWVDPARELFAVMMVQAPAQRDEYRALFRTMVYAALDD
ncbi:MAG: beta-lactamase family protein [Burkholderiaceae bacterium]|nr:beta-lactamase family protein [Burkholderiaceae bacterium]